jgi:hypothetical protein
MTIAKHTLALISIIGSAFDVLGALYLAYDLLGGEHGPLRTLSRAVTYGALFGAGYGIGFGPVLGLSTGVAHGITLASEYSRASKNRPTPGIGYDLAMSAIRGAGFGVGLAYLYGGIFGAVFAGLCTVGQVVAYRAGIRPTMDYLPAARPRLTKNQLIGVAIRTVGYAVAGYLSGLMAGPRVHALAVGVKLGLAIGLVTAIASACMPFIEWGADRVPEKRMGAFGVGLILIGSALQSVQYWVALVE